MLSITIALLALSVLATALPTATVHEPIEVRAVHFCPPLKTLPVQSPKVIGARASAVLATRSSHIPRDARGATIFKSANVSGENTFIPANNYCTNISVVPGGFDGKIKSLSVEKGRKCDFYQEEGCGVNDFTGGGAVLEVGSRKYKDVRRRLGSWEGRIASVYCQRL